MCRKAIAGLIQSTGKALDRFMDSRCAYHGPPIPAPQGLSETLWLDRPGRGTPQEDEAYHLSKWQNQFYGMTDNECVTTSTLIAMNMMDDYACAASGAGADLPDRDIETFTRALDEGGVLAWLRYRLPSPLGFMLPKQHAPQMLKDYAATLLARYGLAFEVEFSSGNTVQDLLDALQGGTITLLHGMTDQDVLRLVDGRPALNPPGFIGGMPHTVVLVGYDPGAQAWLLNDPGHPYRNPPVAGEIPAIRRRPHPEFIAWWGRGGLAHAGFSMTATRIQAGQ